MTTRSTIALNQLALSVHLGWPAKERETPQTVLLDLLLAFKTPPEACITDELQDTLCYDALIQRLQIHLQKKHFRLIEHLGYHLYEQLKVWLPNKSKIYLALTKKPAIPSLTQGVTFSYGDAILNARPSR